MKTFIKFIIAVFCFAVFSCVSTNYENSESGKDIELRDQAGKRGTPRPGDPSPKPVPRGNYREEYNTPSKKTEERNEDSNSFTSQKNAEYTGKIEEKLKKSNLKHGINKKLKHLQDPLLEQVRQGRNASLQSAKKQKAIDYLLERLPNTIDLKMNNQTGTLRFLRGNLMPIVADSAPFRSAREEKDHIGMAISLVEELTGVMDLDAPKEELLVERTTEDNLNMTHIFFQQIYKGTALWGAQISVHFDKEQNPIEVSGVYPPTPDFLSSDPKEEITEKEAVAHAKKAVDISDSLQVPVKVHRIIYWDLNQKPIMTYQVNIMPSWKYDWRVFISTADGRVIHRFNATQSNLH